MASNASIARRLASQTWGPVQFQRKAGPGIWFFSTASHGGYVVDTDKLDPKIATPAFINVNDKTNEGLAYTNKKIFTVQFHPEACPGPQDSSYLFDRFIKMMEER